MKLWKTWLLYKISTSNFPSKLLLQSETFILSSSPGAISLIYHWKISLNVSPDSLLYNTYVSTSNRKLFYQEKVLDSLLVVIAFPGRIRKISLKLWWTSRFYQKFLLASKVFPINTVYKNILIQSLKKNE